MTGLSAARIPGPPTSRIWASGSAGSPGMACPCSRQTRQPWRCGPGAWRRRGENTTAARKLTAVSSFYAWCLGRGDVHANPLADLARSAVDYDTSATPDLTRDQAAALLAAADADAGPRSNGMPPPSALFMHLQVGSRQTGGHSPADSQISWTRFPSCARERRPGRYRATSAP